MRQLALDVETTGIEVEEGHRIIEIACVELFNRKLTGNTYQQYIQPEREIDAEAVKVHGITQKFLADKPKFAAIVDGLLDYIGDTELIIHNAKFDLSFLNYELRRLKGEEFDLNDQCEIMDTLAMARQMHPGVRNNLDALCKRYNIDNSGRDLHGALLDAELLALVYLAMTGGQAKLLFDASDEIGRVNKRIIKRVDSNRPPLAVIMPTAEERRAHEQYLAKMEEETGCCVWRGLQED